MPDLDRNENMIDASKDTFDLVEVFLNRVDGTHFVEDFLTTRTSVVTEVSINTDEEGGGPYKTGIDYYGAIQDSEYYPWIGELLSASPSFKLISTNDNKNGNDKSNRLSCIGVSIQPLRNASGASTHQFVITANYMGSNNNAMWTTTGGLSQELSNFDYNNKLLWITPPSGLTQVSVGDTKLNTSKVAKLPLYVGQPRRSIVWYYLQTAKNDGTNGEPFDGGGQGSVSPVLYSLVGTTNKVAWFEDPARTWLISGVSITTENGVLMRVQVDFIMRWQTWDGVSLWVNADGVISQSEADATAIPSGTDWPASTTGFTATGPDGKVAAAGTTNGWGRFIMAYPVDWTKLFNPNSNIIPYFANLDEIPKRN